MLIPLQKLLKWLCCLTLCSCLGVFASPSETLRYNLNGSNNWVPYYIQHADSQPGILSEFVPLILSDANILGQVVELPPRRTNHALKTGDLDFDIVSPSWFENKKFAATFVQSMPLIPIKEYIVTLQHNRKIWQDKSIKGEILGTVMGYIYPYQKDFIRSDFGSEKALIRALDKQRIQAAIIGDLPAIYWANKLNVKIELAALHSDGHLVIRLRKQHQYLLPRINQSIVKFQQDGTLKKIVEKYASYQ